MSIQREARGTGGVLANTWVQIHEPPTKDEETHNTSDEQSNAVDLANEVPSAPVVTEEVPAQGSSRSLSSGPSGPFRFGSPSLFIDTRSPVPQQMAAVGAAIADDPFNTGVVAPRKRQVKAGDGMFGVPFLKGNSTLSQPQKQNHSKAPQDRDSAPALKRGLGNDARLAYDPVQANKLGS
ncbi:uncharacterized protein B0T23DRAFT_399354 [Neurospora hispaniola]|uniref:Uncharacterized protein n=1 Tax=Neurospora hispaniola TaxID=588809 RepID=A0AAJ0HZ73_9PEZI|nr:hypothetical protein B0T23DRAFT_399354 [Neurospora hispaniola]